ncbi:MAG TPA: protein kinase [Pyrinomonadaceae bacterium]
MLELASGTIIGNYRIGERIGQGGMGIVYRGQHLKLPREVAVKSINATDQRDARRLKARFEKEAFVQSQLDHPNIVKVYDYIAAEQIYYIVMEYVEGRSLSSLLARESNPLPTERALDLFEQILKALTYAQNFNYRDQNESLHHGLIHRDLKPGNILVTADDRVKITDFGIVKLVGSEHSGTLSGAYGSPEYVSPEQAQDREVDIRSDIYSLGIILYEMLTGEPPFCCNDDARSQMEILQSHLRKAPRPPSEVNPQVTPEIEAVILRALEKAPERRFPNAAEFWRALRRARRLDTSGLDEIENAQLASRNATGTHELFEPVTRHVERENYDTQPIGSVTCSECGAKAALSDKHCKACGHELSASPATVKLTRHEAAADGSRRRGMKFWMVASIAALALLSTAIFFARRASAPVAETTPAIAERPTASPVPASALVELKPLRVNVDSSFDGYSARPLTDGETDVKRIARLRYNEGNWASTETSEPHWIELSFDRPTLIAAVYVYWGFDKNRFMPSRRVELQSPDEQGEWRAVSTIEPNNDHDRMAFDFPPVTTERLRIFQPTQQGPTNRPFVMWVREVKVYGVNEGATAK